MKPQPEETQPPFAARLLRSPSMAPPDSTEDDNKKQLREIAEAVHEIRNALVGNPRLGHRGLFHRVEVVEDRVEKHDRKLLVWGSVLTAAGVTLTFVKDKLDKLFS